MRIPPSVVRTERAGAYRNMCLQREGNLKNMCAALQWPALDIPTGQAAKRHRPRLCAAGVDRLTFNGTVIETGDGSYRPASTRARAEELAKAG